MNTDKIGKFQVIGTLGTGAHSTILHVLRKADAKSYALKVVPIAGPEEMKYLEQAQHEFEVAQMLSHPNLVRIYALEIERDLLFRIRKVRLLIEYVNGRTLDTFKHIPIPQLVQIFEKIAAAIVHMHRRQVCHADLKPNNVVLSKTGDVKIIDFGLAWIKGQNKGRVQGTPEYMAPEQVKCALANERTDIYNFGATMYRMLTFRHPPCVIVEKGGLPMDEKRWEKVLKPVNELNVAAPPALCDLIHRCLAFNPQKRPERASELQGALDHLAEDLVQKPEDRLEAMEPEESEW